MKCRDGGRGVLPERGERERMCEIEEKERGERKRGQTYLVFWRRVHWLVAGARIVLGERRQ